MTARGIGGFGDVQISQAFLYWRDSEAVNRVLRFTIAMEVIEQDIAQELAFAIGDCGDGGEGEVIFNADIVMVCVGCVGIFAVKGREAAIIQSQDGKQA